MKSLPLVFLALAGCLLAWVALRTPDPAPGPGAVVAGDGIAVPTELSGVVPEGFVVRTLAVEGMCADCCPPSVYAALAHVEGVREAAVDMDAGTACAVVPAGLDPGELCEALARHEYPATVLP